MHTAISATPILTGRKEQVDAILIHAGQLLLAGPNSSITAYNLPQKSTNSLNNEDERSVASSSSVQLSKPAWIARLNKSTKSIEQLKVIREANVFVSLSDQTVALHDIFTTQETGKQYSSKKVDANTSLLPSAPLIPADASTILIQTKGAISLAIDTSIQPTPNANNGTGTTGTQRGGAGYRHQAGHTTIGRAYRPSDMSMGRAGGATTTAAMRHTNRPMSLLGMEEMKREREQKRKFMTMQARAGFVREEEKNASIEGGTESGVSVVTTLAVGCRRKLIVFRWVDGAFWDTKEIHLPHTPRTLAFPTPEKLFMGYTSSEYAILTIPLAATSSVADLMESGPSLKPVDIPSSSLAGTRVDLYEWKLKTLEIPLVGTFDGSAGESGTASDQGGSEGGQKLTSATATTGSGMTAMAGAAFTGLTGYMGMAGNKNRPLVLQIEDGEVLVCRESTGVFLNEEGRPTRRDGIDWTVVPEEVLYVKPYVLSILPPSAGRQLPANPLLQVRSASTLVAVQTLPFPPATEVSTFSIKSGNYPSVRHLTSSTGNKPPLYVKVTPTERGALEKDGSSIWCLEMKSWGKQVDELVEAGEFQEALALLNSVDEVLLEDKQERRVYIESLYAVSLFSKGQYSEAINHFLELDTNPARVIALYPAFISGPLAKERSQWLEMFGAKKKKAKRSESSATDQGNDTSDTMSIRSGKSFAATGLNIPREQSRLRGLWGRRPQSIVGEPDGFTPGTSPAKGSSLKGNATITSASPLAAAAPIERKDTTDQHSAEVSPQKEDIPVLPAEPKAMPLPSEDERKAIDALGSFLADRRRIFKPILEQQPSSHSITMSQLRHDPEWLLALPSKPLSSLDLEQLTAVAQTVDTALFKTFLATKPGLLGPLCRLENWCEVDQVEQLLMGREKYSELIALYGGKEMHDKALQLLRKMSEDVEDVEDKVEPTVRYLQNLGPDYIDLILRTSHWVLSMDEGWGMDIFTGDTGKVSLLPRFAIVKDLESFDERICILYLQHLIRELGDGDPSLHEKLAFLLLHRAEIIKTESGSDEESLEKRKKALAELLEHLESSHQYRAERVLNRVPTEERDFYDVRALLLGRIGQDEAALRIYVDKLGDHQKAEEYCKRNVAQNPSSNAFLTLLRIYLRPKEASKRGMPSRKQADAVTAEMQLEPALRIISRYGAKIDAKAALELLPSIVPLSAVESFASKALRQTYAEKNEEMILSKIAKERLLQVDETLMALHRRRVKVTETRTCPRCMKRLGNSVIAVTTDGSVLHYGCSKFSN